MEPSDWGGLLEIMYSQFEEKEIDEKIVKLKERLQNLLLVPSMDEFLTAVNLFTEEEKNYLNSPLLDKLSSTHYSRYDSEWVKFVLDSKIQPKLWLIHFKPPCYTRYYSANMYRNADKTFTVVIRDSCSRKVTTDNYTFILSRTGLTSWGPEKEIILPADAFIEGYVKGNYLPLLCINHRYDPHEPSEAFISIGNIDFVAKTYFPQI